MTAPAAAQIQHTQSMRGPMREPVRQPGFEHVRAPMQPAWSLYPAAPNPGAASDFAAHLERGAPPRAPVRQSEDPRAAPAHETRRRAPTNSAQRISKPQREPATEAAPGKPLPDKRQTAAHAAAQTLLAGRLAPAPNTAAVLPASTTPDADPEGPAIADGAILAPSPALIAAPAAPLLPTAAPPAAAANAGTTGHLTAAPPLPGAPAATTPASPAASAVQSDVVQPGPAPQAALLSGAAHAFSLVLEHDGRAPGSPEPVGAEQANDDGTTAPPPAATRAAPSTLAALTNAQASAKQGSGGAALHKARPESEAALPGAGTLSAELTAAALALASPASGSGTGTLGALPGSGNLAAAASAQPAEGIGFDALVDSIARARDEAAGSAANGGPVAVALRHAEFGRVSLRFQTDADGLSVAMTSPDPSFAPAVAAARAAEAAAATASTEAASRTFQSSPGNDLAGSETQDGARSSAGQRQESPSQSGLPGEPARTGTRSNQAPANAKAADRRGGIFA